MLTTFFQGYAHSFAFWNILLYLLAVNTIMQNINYLSMCFLSKPTIGDKIVETLYLTRVTSENKRIRTPPLSPPFKVWVFVVFYR